MSLTLDATPGGTDANAYVTIDEVLVVAPYRGAAGLAFLDLSEDEQIGAIVTVSMDIDATLFAGEKSDAEQAMEFPRDGETTIPVRIKRATIEETIARAALFAEGAAGNPLNPYVASNGNIKSETLDVIKTEYFAPGITQAGSLSRFSLFAQNLLQGFLYVDVGGYSSSATMVRSS